MGIKCIIKHGSLRRNNIEYRVGDEVPGLSPEAIERHEKNGLITVCDTTEVPVFEEPPDVMMETYDEPVTTEDWKDSEVVEPKPKPKKRSYKKKKSSKSGGGKSET